MHIKLDARISQKGITIAVGEREVLIDRRARLAASTAIVVALHWIVLAAMFNLHPKPYDLLVVDEDVIDTELYRVEPLPEVEPIPAPVVKTHEVPEPQPPKPQPPQPQQQTQVVPTPDPYQPLPKAVPRPVETLQTVRTPVAKSQAEPKLQTAAIPVPVLEDDPVPSPNLKTKRKDEERLEAKPQVTANANVDDMKLHDSPLPSIQSVTPSGLQSDNTHLASGGGGAPSAGASGGGSVNGKGLKGRSGVTQALQNHDSCVTIQTNGKPIPAPCNMKSLSQMTSLGTGRPESRAYYGPIVAKKDAEVKYKNSPGNADYWKRVNGSPSPRYEPPDGSQKPGSYANSKDERVMNGLNTDPKSSVPK